MINNLDEAISHTREKAKEILKANEEMPTDCKLSEGLCECAKEHEQLAEWLEELKARREADRWIPVTERLPEKKGWYEATFISVTGARTVGLAFYSDRVEDFAVDGVIAWKPLPKSYESEDE